MLGDTAGGDEYHAGVNGRLQAAIARIIDWGVEDESIL
jgi:hypothetical protein